MCSRKRLLKRLPIEIGRVGCHVRRNGSPQRFMETVQPGSIAQLRQKPFEADGLALAILTVRFTHRPGIKIVTQIDIIATIIFAAMRRIAVNAAEIVRLR